MPVSTADRLAGELRTYERLLRQTLAAGGRLVTVAAEAQADRALPPTAGCQIYNAFSAANLDVSTAIGHVARGHRQLDAMARNLGVDLTGYGKTHEPPEPGFFTSAEVRDDGAVA